MSAVVFEPVGHTYTKDGAQLTSVSTIVKRFFPMDPGISPDVLENARDRGVAVDSLLCAWLAGTLTEIPAGTRQDAKELFLKLVDWWPKQGFGEAKTQVMMDDGEIAGTCDLLIGEAIFDLKCTYEVQPEHSVQLGGYGQLFECNNEYLRPPKRLAVIHVTARNKEPKLIDYEPSTAISEFRVLRDAYRLITRKSASKRRGG